MIPVGLAWAPCSSQALLQLGAVAHVLLWPQKDGVRWHSLEIVPREEEKRVLRKDGRGSETNLINFTVCLELAQPSKIIQGRI